MNKLKQLDVVALTISLPEEKLRRGEIGTVVKVYNDGEEFEVEFVDKDGQTYGLIPLHHDQVELLRRYDN